MYLAAQNPAIPLAAVALAGLVNVAGDYVTVQLLGWGIAGAAWATVLAQVRRVEAAQYISIDVGLHNIS